MNLSKLPKYPLFRKLNLKDKYLLDNISTARKIVVADITFTNLYNWGTRSKCTQLSKLNDNLVIKTYDLVTNDFTVWLVGSRKLNSTIKLLLQDNEKVCILENTLKKINVNKFLIEEDFGNNEYVLTASSLLQRSGSKYRQFREDLIRFEKNFPGTSIKILNGNYRKSEMLKIISKVFEDWENYKSISKEVSKLEKIALFRMLKNESLYKIVLLTLSDDDKTLGFSVLEVINKNIIIGFAKASLLADGITSTMIKGTAEYANQHGYKYINLEQDLNIASLRKFKEKFNPQLFVRKFLVSLVKDLD